MTTAERQISCSVPCFFPISDIATAATATTAVTAHCWERADDGIIPAVARSGRTSRPVVFPTDNLATAATTTIALDDPTDNSDKTDHFSCSMISHTSDIATRATTTAETVPCWEPADDGIIPAVARAGRSSSHVVIPTGNLATAATTTIALYNPIDDTDKTDEFPCSVLFLQAT